MQIPACYVLVGPPASDASDSSCLSIAAILAFVSSTVCSMLASDACMRITRKSSPSTRIHGKTASKHAYSHTTGSKIGESPRE